MGIRISRYLNNRVVSNDQYKILGIWPVWGGEQSRHLSMRFGCVTQGTAETIEKWPEVNFIGLFVPWAVIMSYADQDKDRATQNTPFPSSTGGWDARFEQLLINRGDDANQYYGGDVQHDVQESLDENLPTGSDTGTADDRFMGPLGVSRWFSDETIVAPWGADGGNQVRKAYMGSYNSDLRSGPGVFAFGAYRSKVLEGSSEYDHVTANRQSANIAMPILLGGDILRIQKIINDDETELGDFVRTALFSGDNFSDVAQEQWSTQPLQCFVKAAHTCETPYDMHRI